MVAAILLGFGRALGEAIAVTQVIGSAPGIHLSFFGSATRWRAGSPTSTRARYEPRALVARLPAPPILLVFSLVVNVSAQIIVKRFELKQGGAE